MALNYRWIAAGFVVWAALPLFSRHKVRGQPTLPAPPGEEPSAPSPLRGDFAVSKLPIHIFRDQAAIFFSPAQLRSRDLRWLVPLVVATAGSLATDRVVMSDLVPHDRLFNRCNAQLSDRLITALLAAPLCLFAVGNLFDHEKSREAGFVGGEAIVDAYLVDQAFKLISWRERPDTDSGRGRFFVRRSGLDSSFFSSHSMLAWTSAAVLASEYPNLRVQALVYTTAAGISITRVLAQRHFPTDVLLGGTVGWFLGHFVFCARHRLSPR